MLVLVAVFAADLLIFHPPGTPYPDKSGFITIPGEPEIAAYYRPASAGEPIILFSHGNAQNLSSLHEFMDEFSSRGFGAIAYDYPGYGETSGRPTEQSCYDAITAVYQHLTNTLGYHPNQVILCGQSIGTGPTCWLATQVEHRSVILFSPFLSAFRSVTRIPLFPQDRFPNLKRISDITTPLLVIHGEKDRVIPHAQGERIYQTSPSQNKAFLSLPSAGHNDLFWIANEEIFQAISDHAFRQ